MTSKEKYKMSIRFWQMVSKLKNNPCTVCGKQKACAWFESPASLSSYSNYYTVISENFPKRDDHICGAVSYELIAEMKNILLNLKEQGI